MPSSFGQRLKRIREQRGFSQQELSRRSGVPYESIYRVERGMHQEPRVSVAAKLALALGVSLDVLAGLYEDKGADDEEESAVSVISAKDLLWVIACPVVVVYFRDILTIAMVLGALTRETIIEYLWA